MHLDCGGKYKRTIHVIVTQKEEINDEICTVAQTVIMSSECRVITISYEDDFSFKFNTNRTVRTDFHWQNAFFQAFDP